MENKTTGRIQLQLTESPHLKRKLSVRTIMWLVVLALMPATASAVYSYGINALAIILMSIITAVGTEALFNILIIKKGNTTLNGSAAITGLLLALALPPTVPYWIPVVGAFIAITIGKLVFGGLGHNIFNPALVGRAFLVAAWPVLMTAWAKPIRTFMQHSYDSVTSATPLAIAKQQGAEQFIAHSGGYIGTLKSLLFSSLGGTIGEVSVIALLVGGLFLIFTKIIDWRIPFAYLGTMALLSFAFGSDPLFHVLAGGVILGAFFMATDYVTSPITRKGKLLFGFGCGLFTIIIRIYSDLPGGVTFAILLMNSFTPLIDRFIKPKRFGT